MILVDTNVLLDVLQDDPQWADWSQEQLEAASLTDLFLAGKAFLMCRRRQGTKRGVLPDFYIGAHAAVAGYPILTRDAGRYRSYFPTVRLIVPE